MQLTKKASYGLIATFELARSGEEVCLSAASIANRYGLPVPFIEKIMHELKRAGLVDSKQGRGGGYFLAQPARETSVRSVLEALDESLDLVGCLGSGECCELTDICPTKPAWGLINGRFLHLLDSLTLSDLGHSSSEDSTHL